MKFELVKLTDLSGKRATIYSVVVDDAEQTLFDKFVSENDHDFSKEIDDIFDKLEVIAHKTGVVEAFLTKPEGNWGQDVWALFDQPEKRLRLYFIRLGRVAIILGGGGPKPKHIVALQEDPKLKAENYLLRTISDQVTARIMSRELLWSGIELDGSDDAFVFEGTD